jgi:hypothetical protein
MYVRTPWSYIKGLPFNGASRRRRRRGRAADPEPEGRRRAPDAEEEEGRQEQEQESAAAIGGPWRGALAMRRGVGRCG